MADPIAPATVDLAELESLFAKRTFPGAIVVTEDEITVAEMRALIAAAREVARLREWALKAFLCLDGFAGDGIAIEGDGDPVELCSAGAVVLGIADASDWNVAARAALAGGRDDA